MLAYWSRGRNKGSFFNCYYTDLQESPTLFFVSLTLDIYLIMLSVKQGSIRYHFWVVGMTQPEIEPRFARSLVNTLTIIPMHSYTHIYTLTHLYGNCFVLTDDSLLNAHHHPHQGVWEMVRKEWSRTIEISVLRWI